MVARKHARDAKVSNIQHSIKEKGAKAPFYTVLIKLVSL